MRIFAVTCALAVAACSDTPGKGSSDGRASEDAPGGALVDAASPDAVPVPECDDLQERIQLSDQVSANVGKSASVYPLVLAHGAFGFDQLGFLGYWGGAERHLRDAGYATYVTAVTPIAITAPERGPDLARQIACIADAAGVDKVNIVGHSQGGLDARYVASGSPYGIYVASVTTIATPHHGTELAAAVSGSIPGLAQSTVDAIASLWAQLLGAPANDADVTSSLAAMSPAAMLQFNADYPDVSGVPVYSWAGRSVRTLLNTSNHPAECAGSVIANPSERDVIRASLYVSWEFLNMQVGANDGVVPTESAKWGTFMGCVPADHLDQVGMFVFPETNPVSGFNHKVFLLDIATLLSARGH